MIRSRLDMFVVRSMFFTASMILSGSIVVAQSPTPAATADAPASPQLAPAKPAAPETPKAAITILEDTLIRVRTLEPLNSKRAKEGSPVLFMISEDVFAGDVLAIPQGATVHGVVIKSKKSGVLTGSPELALELESLDLGGRSYPLVSYQFKVKGASKTKPTETKALRGAEVGVLAASIGVSEKYGTGATGRAASLGTNAAVGAGIGTLVSAATPGPGIWFPSEAQVDFYLAAPVTVTPVSEKEAARLSRGLHPGGPTLYLRGDAP